MQKVGEAVFIPAGCPHQVRNLKVIVLSTDIFLIIYLLIKLTLVVVGYGTVLHKGSG